MKRGIKSLSSPSLGVPRRSWIAIPLRRRLFDESGSAHKEHEQTIRDLPARIASLRRSCEILRIQAASRSDYLRAIRLQEILAEASQLVSAIPTRSES